MSLSLHVPAFEELDFRQKLYADPETMTYNRGYAPFAGYDPVTGIIDFSKDRWDAWYEKWIGRVPERFYAYLQREDGVFVGDVCWYITGNEGERMIGIVIHSAYRGMGYGAEGLRLLIGEAFSHGEITALCNEFESARTAAVQLHRRAGFAMRYDGETVRPVLKREDVK
ncbi:MAG: GNAT family N-acetyltransferase [Oscillospiraceae bacterium]|nr:GNAT family N-acetyltransferase [Oscillospiraceae bacterium]